MSAIIFTPASIEAFKRAARDLQKAYGNPLQECQEALAKSYGYLDLHALQQHLKTNPTPGPYPDDVDDLGKRFELRLSVPGHIYSHLKPKHIDRLRAEDLGLTERPEIRKTIMEEQKAIDDLLSGDAESEPDTPTTEYLFFEHDKSLKEGILRRTPKSEIVHAALVYLDECEEDAKRNLEGAAWSKEMDRILASRKDLVEIHPNSPYVHASFLASIYRSCGEGGPSEKIAKELWPDIMRCREMFERVVPRGFRQGIEPKLVGRGADNFPYLEILWMGASCAAEIGLESEALKWARKGRTLNKNDNFGFRFLIEG